MLSRKNLPTSGNFGNAEDFMQNYRDHGMSGVRNGSPSDSANLFKFAKALQDENGLLWNLVNKAVEAGVLQDNDGEITFGGATVSTKVTNISKAPSKVAEKTPAADSTASSPYEDIPGAAYVGTAILAQMESLIRAEKVIQALKLFREETGSGLKPAKEFVDKMIERIRNVAPITEADQFVTGAVLDAKLDAFKTELLAAIRVGTPMVATIVPDKETVDPAKTIAEVAEKATKVEPVKPKGPIAKAKEINPKPTASKPVEIKPVSKIDSSKPVALPTAAQAEAIDTYEAFKLLAGGKAKQKGDTIFDAVNSKDISYKTFRMRDNAWFERMGFKVDASKRAAGKPGWLTPTAAVTGK